VLKHLLHPRRVFGHVDVLEGNPPFAVVLPGGRGVGSGVLAEDQHFVRHPRTLLIRLLKKAHLRRWRTRAALRRTDQVRLAPAPILRMGTRRAALHLDLFEQPGLERLSQPRISPGFHEFVQGRREPHRTKRSWQRRSVSGEARGRILKSRT
jgi:hypothetical protein